uniref:Uncharacterized protein n=1 Tax=Picea sitchensis TaxID=3332 RepID=A0A6B9XWV9_PICSI|nr:hypothetical protein Q903MT_gene5621 [Picea sitchensis]
MCFRFLTTPHSIWARPELNNSGISLTTPHFDQGKADPLIIRSSSKPDLTMKVHLSLTLVQVQGRSRMSYY